jgi:hypothetical protein
VGLRDGGLEEGEVGVNGREKRWKCMIPMKSNNHFEFNVLAFEFENERIEQVALHI